MKQIVLNGKEFDLPEEWTEVDPKKLPELLRLLYTLPENGSTYHELLRVTLDYSPRQWTKLMQRYFGKNSTAESREASSNVLAEVIRLLSWMWKSELTIQPFESFRVGDQQWLLFEEGLKSMSFGEMADAYIHSQAFIRQLIEGDERLDVLVATVCRPERKGDYRNDPKWNGDRREEYNEHIARQRASLLKDGYMEEKVIVLMYFLSSIKDFLSYYDIFEPIGNTPPKAEDFPGQSMIKNQHLLSEKHIFGGMKETKAANVHDVFQFLEEYHKDEKERYERQKAANNDTH